MRTQGRQRPRRDFPTPPGKPGLARDDSVARCQSLPDPGTFRFGAGGFEGPVGARGRPLRALPELMERLKANHPHLSKLEASLRQKQKRFEEKKREFLTSEPKTGEWKDEYQKLLAELDVIGRAIPEEKKRLLEVHREELAKIGERCTIWIINGL